MAWLGLTAHPALADLTPPSGNAVTAGLITGAVLRDPASNSAFVDGELAWTHYPTDFAGGLLAPGLIADVGYEFQSSRLRVTPAVKLGILYVLSLEAGYALRWADNDQVSGPSGRVRINVPLGVRTYASAYARTSVFSDNSRDTEFGLGVKVLLWGDSSKLEGILNR